MLKFVVFWKYRASGGTVRHVVIDSSPSINNFKSLLWPEELRRHAHCGY